MKLYWTGLKMQQGMKQIPFGNCILFELENSTEARKFPSKKNQTIKIILQGGYEWTLANQKSLG